MSIRRRLLLGIIPLLGLLLAVPASAQDPISDCQGTVPLFFPETRHRVCGQFEEFFNARGGLALFGYPITAAFLENGRPVQYFQRVRMEYHPEQPADYQVQLGLLGDEFAPPDRLPRISDSEKPKSNDPARRYFKETGHTVQFGFLEFFNAHGGLDIFGYPVTEFFLENGRVVQYFQRAKMEWNPNLDGIVLHYLGEMWVDQHTELRRMRDSELAPGQSVVAPTPVVSALHATASVRDAFTGRESEQTVWVYVTDQFDQPVEGAEVALLAFIPPGVRPLPIDATDDLGHTQATFSLNDLTPGQLVILEARVRYGGLETRARAFFLAWW